MSRFICPLLDVQHFYGIADLKKEKEEERYVNGIKENR